MRKILFILLFLIMISPSSIFAQRKGSRDLGGGISFVAPSDSVAKQLFVFGVLGYYMDKDKLFEIEPILNANFSEGDIDLTGFILGNFSIRIITMAMGDYRRYRRDSRNVRSEAGVFMSVGAGMWLDSYKDQYDNKVYSAPALSFGIGTHSLLGSLTSMRTQVKYLYNFPAGKEHTNSWSTVLVTTSFSVFTKL